MSLGTYSNIPCDSLSAKLEYEKDVTLILFEILLKLSDKVKLSNIKLLSKLPKTILEVAIGINVFTLLFSIFNISISFIFIY